MFEDFLAPDVVFIYSLNTTIDRTWSAFALENDLIGNTPAKRRHEFLEARECARTALEKFGVDRQAIPKRQDGQPVWPAGLVGSLTHCDGFYGSVVADRAAFLSVGLDAEPNDALEDDVLRLIAAPSEIAHLTNLSAKAPHIAWSKFIFSAKEAAYKALNPLTGSWIDFEDAEIHFSIDDPVFHVSFNKPSLQIYSALIRGRWQIQKGFLITFVEVKRRRDEEARSYTR